MEPIPIEMSLFEIITVKAVLRTKAKELEKHIGLYGDPHGAYADNLADINSVIDKLSKII